MKLRNGNEHDTKSLMVLHGLLRNLLNTDGILFYELVMRCRNPEHPFFGNTEKALRERSWLDPNGQPNHIVRELVDHVVAGDGIDMTLMPLLRP